MKHIAFYYNQFLPNSIRCSKKLNICLLFNLSTKSLTLSMPLARQLICLISLAARSSLIFELWTRSYSKTYIGKLLVDFIFFRPSSNFIAISSLMAKKFKLSWIWSLSGILFKSFAHSFIADNFLVLALLAKNFQVFLNDLLKSIH